MIFIKEKLKPNDLWKSNITALDVKNFHMMHNYLASMITCLTIDAIGRA